MISVAAMMGGGDDGDQRGRHRTIATLNQLGVHGLERECHERAE